MHDFLAARLAQLIADACFDRVRVAPASLAGKLLPDLRRLLPGVAFVAADGAAGPGTLTLVDTLPAVSAGPATPVLVLVDLYHQLRLAPFAGGLVQRDERISVAWADPQTQTLLEMPTRDFEVIRAHYGSGAVPAVAATTAA